MKVGCLMFIYHLPIIRIEPKALMNIHEGLQQNKGEKGKKREKEKNGKWNKKSGSANSITVSLHGHAVYTVHTHSDTNGFTILEKQIR